MLITSSINAFAGAEVGVLSNNNTTQDASSNTTGTVTSVGQGANNVTGSSSITSTINGGSADGGTIVNQATQPTNTRSTIVSVPNVNNASLTSGGYDVCLGSASGGGSITGFGLSFGTTKTDDNCVTVKQVTLLNNMGLKDAAIARMLQDPKLRDALLTANPQFAALINGHFEFK